MSVLGCRRFSITELTEHMHYYKLKIYISEKGKKKKKKTTKKRNVDSKELSQSPQCPVFKELHLPPLSVSA